MKTVRNVLGDKGHSVHTISPDATVLEALQEMADRNVGALVVLSEGDVVGLISERDYARKVILKGRFSKDVPVHEIMTREVVCASSKNKMDACMALMTEKRVRHLPILENGQLAGSHLDRGCREGDHRGPAVHDRAARALHHRRLLVAVVDGVVLGTPEEVTPGTRTKRSGGRRSRPAPHPSKGGTA